MALLDVKPVANEGSDFAVLTEAFGKIGIDFLFRNGNRSESSGYSYVFVSPRESLAMIAAHMSVEDAPLDVLCMSNRFFEFDKDGSIASY